MRKMTRLLVATIVMMSMMFVTPVFAAETKVADTEIDLGMGHPLWGTHTDNDNNHFDGGDSWLGFASIDKKVEDSKWLSYGLMYNIARVKMGVEKTTTHKGNNWDRCWGDGDKVICLPLPTAYDIGDEFPIYNPEYTTTSESHSWLTVHVLGPYAKPHYNVTKRIKLFAMVGVGLMYVDGKIYGDEFGAAGFASAGVSLDVYKNFGISGQMLYVKGATSHVDDVDYYAPVISLNYKF
jgi:hypothetical protein